MLRQRGLVLVWLVAFGIAAVANAQQGGSAIRGRVVDEQPAVLPGVAILITHAENGTVRETVTGADGSFLVPGLLPGPYHVQAELAGFSRLKQDNVVLRIGATLQLGFQIGGILRRP